MRKVEKYVEENFRRERTRYQYKSHLKLYFKFLNVDPATYFDMNRNYEDDIKKYWNYLNNVTKDGKPKYAPKSIAPKISCIKNYMEEHKIILNPRFFKKLAKRGRGNAVITKDRIPIVAEIKSIISHGSIKDRAYFLTMLSSGMRENELCNIKISDIDFDSTPVKITLSGTYTKNKENRFTFITPEARDAILQWLKVRKEYMERNMRRFTGLRSYLEKEFQKEINSEDDGRVFPFQESKIRKRWNALLEKAGLDEKDPTTGDNLLHLYTLRKFFNTRLKKIIPEHIVKAFMGHEGYLNGSYDRFTEEELANYYMQGQHLLYIFELPANSEETENIKQQMEKLQQQVQDLLTQTQWHKESIVEPISEEPIMDDNKALKEYEKQKATIKEIKEEGMTTWGTKQRDKAKIKQKEK